MMTLCDRRYVVSAGFGFCKTTCFPRIATCRYAGKAGHVALSHRKKPRNGYDDVRDVAVSSQNSEAIGFPDRCTCLSCVPERLIHQRTLFQQPGSRGLKLPRARATARRLWKRFSLAQNGCSTAETRLHWLARPCPAPPKPGPRPDSCCRPSRSASG